MALLMQHSEGRPRGVGALGVASIVLFEASRNSELGMKVEVRSSYSDFQNAAVSRR